MVSYPPLLALSSGWELQIPFFTAVPHRPYDTKPPELYLARYTFRQKMFVVRNRIAIFARRHSFWRTLNPTAMENGASQKKNSRSALRAEIIQICSNHTNQVNLTLLDFFKYAKTLLFCRLGEKSFKSVQIIQIYRDRF